MVSLNKKQWGTIVDVICLSVKKRKKKENEVSFAS